MYNFSRGDLVVVRLDGDPTWIPAIYIEKKNEYHSVNLANVASSNVHHLVKDCKHLVIDRGDSIKKKLYNAVLYLCETLGTLQDGVLPPICTKGDTGKCKHQKFIHNSDSNWPDGCSECWLDYVLDKYNIADEELQYDIEE